MKKSVNMHETFMTEKALASKTFRILAHRNEDTPPPNSNDIASYRQTLKLQRTKRSCKPFPSSTVTNNYSGEHKRQRLTLKN